MSTRSRADSMPPKPDMRLKENKLLLPPAPAGLTRSQRSKWQENMWQQLNQPMTNPAPNSLGKVEPTATLSNLPAVPKGGVGGSWSRGGERRKRPWNWAPLWKALWSFKGWSALTMLACAILFGGHEGPVAQLARVLGAAASVSEAASLVMTQALNVTSTMGATATEVFLQVTSNGLSASANAWHGVELSNLSASRCAGLVVVDDDIVLHDWLLSPEAQTLLPCVDADLQDQLLAAAASVSVQVPSAQSSTERLNLTGAYVSQHVTGSLNSAGRIQVHFDRVTVTFIPLWANPVWEMFQFRLEAEREQIQRQLRQTLLDLPRPLVSHSLEWHPVTLAWSGATIWARLLVFWRWWCYFGIIPSMEADDSRWEMGAFNVLILFSTIFLLACMWFIKTPSISADFSWQSEWEHVGTDGKDLMGEESFSPSPGRTTEGGN